MVHCPGSGTLVGDGVNMKVLFPLSMSSLADLYLSGVPARTCG